MRLSDIDEYIKNLEHHVNKLEKENSDLKQELARKIRTINLADDSYKHIHPTRLIHTKSRGNTSIIFYDGSSETVHLKKGEKDCLDTAVAYALMKHVYPKNVIKELIKKVEEN